jgi:putative ABC transport system ATP-binding protein
MVCANFPKDKKRGDASRRSTILREMNGTNDGQAIRAESVSRHYQIGDAVIRAVDGVTFQVERGEFVSLLGASGSGKSTLLNLLAGLDRPTEGEIWVESRSLGAMSPIELARYRSHTVGMVFQAFNLLPRMTLEENVELPLRLAEVDRTERAARVREALERVGLGRRLAHRPGEMSGGEQQRAALARALVNRPGILLADEPTGNLDSKTGAEIMELLREFNDKLSMTIVMVTHEASLADRFSDRIVTIADGKLLSNVVKS